MKMTIEEFDNIASPPIEGEYQLPSLTVKDVMFAAYRVKQNYGINCQRETSRLLKEICDDTFCI